MPLPKPPRRKAAPVDVAGVTGSTSIEESTNALQVQRADLRAGGGAATKAVPVKKAARRASPAKVRKVGVAATTKLFVLDTNVMMHDPSSLFRFAEHDVYLPMITLEELDNNKKGMTDASRNARQVSRELDSLATGHLKDGEGVSLNKSGHRESLGKLFFQTASLDVQLPIGLPDTKNDNQILGVTQALGKLHPGREVVLVSKDINVRIKARALGLNAEDYSNDKTLEDGDILYSGYMQLPNDFWDKHGNSMEVERTRDGTLYRIRGPIVAALSVNLFVYLDDETQDAFAGKVISIAGNTAVIQTLRDYVGPKNAIWGVTAKNREQNFALNMLMDPECDFLTLTGTAGTGKTLMTIAAALAQTVDEKRYSEIIVTRATVSMGEDIGFLPGTEEEKMAPWMGALDDNLEFLASNTVERGDFNRAASATNDVIRSKIKVKSMNFMRGRTFMNKFVIIDEAQNLTPKQMKALITRAGPGTKIVCMGNLAQIDTPYLTEGSSGLTYAVDRFKGWPHGGHVTLARGERSRLADFASEAL